MPCVLLSSHRRQGEAALGQPAADLHAAPHRGHWEGRQAAVRLGPWKARFSVSTRGHSQSVQNPQLLCVFADSQSCATAAAIWEVLFMTSVEVHSHPCAHSAFPALGKPQSVSVSKDVLCRWLQIKCGLSCLTFFT